MKTKCLIVCLVLFQAFCAYSQAPEKISYQATIRNADNALLSDTRVAVKIAVLHKSLTGTSVYEEIHAPVTSSNGAVSLMIGGGTTLKGEFSSIDWSEGPYFVETSVDINGGTSYETLAASELLSVPYALHANTAKSLVNGSDYTRKSRVISLLASRDVKISDIGNIIECTADATITLFPNFTDMKTGDVINLEAHNGAKLILEAAQGVTINYSKNKKATFSSKPGNIRFGLLRKIADNAYIISGQ